MALEKFNSVPLFNENDIWVIFDTAQQYVGIWQDQHEEDEVSFEVLNKCLRESVEDHVKLVLRGG